MYQIVFSSTYKALDRFIDLHNANCEELTERIRGNVHHTAKEIIRVYGAQLLKSKQAAPPNAWKPLQTNNGQLATLTKTSTRTIQRHVLKLIEVGILEQKKVTGKGYQLYVNPRLLKTSTPLQNTGGDKVRNAASPVVGREEERETLEADLPPTSTNCLPSYTGNSNNNIIIAVDSGQQHTPQVLSALVTLSNNTGYTLTGYTEKQVGGLQNEGFGKSSTQGNGFASFGQTKKEAENTPVEKLVFDAEKQVHATRYDNLSPQVTDRSTLLHAYVSSLWTLAKNSIYKDRYLSDYQVRSAIELIADFYRPVATEKLHQVHAVYVNRMRMASQHLQRDKSRYAQLPDRYFNTNNPAGFTGTKKWYDKAEQQRKEASLKQMVKQEVNALLKQYEAKATESLADCYKNSLAKLEKLQRPDLVALYQESIASHKYFTL